MFNVQGSTNRFYLFMKTIDSIKVLLFLELLNVIVIGAIVQIFKIRENPKTSLCQILHQTFQYCRPPEDHSSAVGKEVKGKNHMYYQVLIDARDCPHIVGHDNAEKRTEMG